MTNQPEETPPILSPLTVRGSISFSCCGKPQQKEGDFVRTVRCSECHTDYNLTLILSSFQGELWPRGTKLRMKQTTETKAGQKKVTLNKGDLVTIDSDPHGLLGTHQGEVLVQILSPVRGDQNRKILAPVPTEALEELLPPT